MNKIVLFLLSSFFVWSCNNSSNYVSVIQSPDSLLWNSIKNIYIEDTIQNFVKKYPDSKYANLAYEMISYIKEERVEWNKTRTTKNTQIYETFLSRFPIGYYKDSANIMYLRFKQLKNFEYSDSLISKYYSSITTFIEFVKRKDIGDKDAWFPEIWQFVNGKNINLSTSEGNDTKIYKSEENTIYDYDELENCLKRLQQSLEHNYSFEIIENIYGVNLTTNCVTFIFTWNKSKYVLTEVYRDFRC